MRDDLAFVDVQHRFTKSPDAAPVDRFAAGESRVEAIAIRHRIAFNAEQLAAFTRVANLGNVEAAFACDALQPFTHSARTPCFAIGDTRATDSTEPNAACIAAAAAR